MTDLDYPGPVSRLLTLGECRRMGNWSDYLAMGIGPEQIPDLMRMMQDGELNQDYDPWIGEETPEILGRIGPDAVPKLAKCLATPHNGMWTQRTASFALVEIGNRHPKRRPR
jgi:hypothetical protein